MKKIHDQIAIAIAKAKKKPSGYAPDEPKETVRLDDEISVLTVSIMVMCSAAIGIIGLTTLIIGIMSSGGFLPFLKYFGNALIGN